MSLLKGGMHESNPSFNYAPFTRPDNRVQSNLNPEHATEIEKKITNDSLELLMPGRIDGEAADQMEIEVIAGMQQGMNAIHVNLDQATFPCSAGIRVLPQNHRKLSKQGGMLQVSHAAPQVVAALELAGFPEIIEK